MIRAMLHALPLWKRSARPWKRWATSAGSLSAPARQGLIVVVLPNLDNPFYAKIVKGIQVAAKKTGGWKPSCSRKAIWTITPPG